VFGIGVDAGGEASPFHDLLSYLGAAIAHWLSSRESRDWARISAITGGI
jgi:hypothetical protein